MFSTRWVALSDSAIIPATVHTVISTLVSHKPCHCHLEDLVQHLHRTKNGFALLMVGGVFLTWLQQYIHVTCSSYN